MSIIENIYPDKLKIGDTIGIAAPAGSFNKEIFAQGVKILEQMGFNVRLPQEIMLEEVWFAGDDDTRVGVLHHLFQDPEVKAIVCARGGYGSMRILEKTDFDIVRNNPKIFAGFSDISVLLSAFEERAGLVCYHAPVVTSLVEADDSTIKAFKKMLTMETDFVLTADTGVRICDGNVTGKLVGGNLTTLNHLLGTGFTPDFKGGILMLEDIAEAPYKIDRMLNQMKLAGIFSGVYGVALGTFENCGDFDEIVTVFEDIFADDNIPVIAGLPFGHSKLNLPFPVGAMATLDSENCSVAYKI